MCQVFAADFNFGHLMSGWPLQRLPTTFEMCAKYEKEKKISNECKLSYLYVCFMFSLKNCWFFKKW